MDGTADVRKPWPEKHVSAPQCPCDEVLLLSEKRLRALFSLVNPHLFTTS